MEAFSTANSLFVDEDYAAALSAYNEAIELDPSRADFYVKRAATHEKLGQFSHAVQDADKALQLDSRSVPAYFRKGVALFHLGEFETARSAFQAALAIDVKHAQCQRWKRKCDAELDASDDESDTRTASEVATDLPSQVTADLSGERSADPLNEATNVQQMAAPLVRHSWYQDAQSVTLEFYAKKRSQDDVIISLEPAHLHVEINVDGPEPFVFDTSLFAPVDTAQSRHHLSPYKLEITLKKASALSWDTLEASATSSAQQVSVESSSGKLEAPWAHKKKVDWDHIDVPEDKVEGEAALNKVFQDIFAKGSDDQKRAMMKSFVESGGTVLSTNWDDVGKKKVEIQPPSGMEVHKWNE